MNFLIWKRTDIGQEGFLVVASERNGRMTTMSEPFFFLFFSMDFLMWDERFLDLG